MKIFNTGILESLFVGAIIFAPQMLCAQVFEIGEDGELSNISSPLKTVTKPKSTILLQSASKSLTPEKWHDLMVAIALKNELNPQLFEALIYQESRWNPAAISPKGAIGLTQLMPATAKELGVDPYDPLANLEGGARYLKQQLDRFNGNTAYALAAYNAGAGRVIAANGIPPISETQQYVIAILNRFGQSILQETDK